MKGQTTLKCPNDFNQNKTKWCDKDVPTDMLTEIQNKFPGTIWVCSRPKGHVGLHHAHEAPTNECRAVWET